MGKIKKTYAKAYGLKSTLAVGNMVYTSQFENGNTGLVVKQIDKDDNVSVYNNTKAKFDINSNSQKLNLVFVPKNGNEKQVQINNPLTSKKADPIGLNEKIELEFFGKNFNDNVHIQIAHNILDINKIISLYSYHIVYSVNALARNREYEEESDVIGTLKWNMPFESFDSLKNKAYPKFKDFSKDYLNYYPIFRKSKFGDSDENKKKVEKYNYNVLRLLSFIRQSIAHSTNENKNFLFKIDEKLPDDLKRILSNRFEKDLESINKVFFENSHINLSLISKLLHQPINQELIQSYYDFAMLKKGKNICISIKKLRETAYETHDIDIRDKNYDSIRNKINVVFDFLIYNYFINNESVVSETVDALRFTLDEEEKDSIYINLAKKVWEKEFYNIPKIISNEVRNNKQHKKYKLATLNVIHYQYFSKLMYFMSQFLDDKQKNDLLTTLINKFENIASLLDVLTNQLHLSVDLKEEYSMLSKLDNVKTICDELKIVKSVADKKISSKLDDANPSRTLQEDALKTLGMFDDEKIKETIDSYQKVEEGDHKIRNFIYNSIINSRRFEYVIKYMNSENVRNIIENTEIVKAVLNTIDEKQIDRYCKFLEISNDKINTLTKKLQEFNYFNISGNNYKNKQAIEKLKSLVNLYYTVPYLVVKNLVNINSVFVVAFTCYERDYSLVYQYDKRMFDDDSLKLLDLNIKYYNDNLKVRDKKGNVKRFKTSGDEIIDCKKKHNLDYLTDNKKTYSDIFFNSDSFKILRNKTLHMNFISTAFSKNANNSLVPKNLDLSELKDSKCNSPYYNIYAYVVEKTLINNIKDADLSTYIDDIKRYNSYSKDMLKIIYLPLAYNLARYKNLTIRDLFYDLYDKESNE